jgi:hypothetical protein
MKRRHLANTGLAALVNAVVFQLAWAACVIGGANGLWWAGPIVVAAFAWWQVPRSRRPRGELALMAIAAVAGLAIDTAYLRLGLVSYPAHGPGFPLAPLWIVALWIGFALTLNHSMTWLHGRPLVAALFGGVGGPFSFWIAVETWGAASFVAPQTTVLAVLAVVWSVVTPTLLWIAHRVSKVSPTPDAPETVLASASEAL